MWMPLKKDPKTIKQFLTLVHLIYFKRILLYFNLVKTTPYLNSSRKLYVAQKSQLLNGKPRLAKWVGQNLECNRIQSISNCFNNVHFCVVYSFSTSVTDISKIKIKPQSLLESWLPQIINYFVPFIDILIDDLKPLSKNLEIHWLLNNLLQKSRRLGGHYGFVLRGGGQKVKIVMKNHWFQKRQFYL